MNWTALLVPEVIIPAIGAITALIGIPLAVIRFFMARVEATRQKEKAESDARILQLENDTLEARSHQHTVQTLLESMNSNAQRDYEMQQRNYELQKTFVEAINNQTLSIQDQTNVMREYHEKAIAENQRGFRQVHEAIKGQDGKLDTMIQQFGKVSRGMDATSEAARRSEKASNENQRLINKLIAGVEAIAPAIQKMQDHLSHKLDDLKQQQADGQSQVSIEHEDVAAKLVHLEYMRQSIEDIYKHINQIIEINGEQPPKAA